MDAPQSSRSGRGGRRTPRRPVRRDAWASPGFLLWHTTLRWQRETAAVLRPIGLTHVQFLLLASTWWLEEEWGRHPSQRELAEHAGTDHMMTSQVVRALERDGHLERVTDPDDRRVRRVQTTPSGQALAIEGVRVMNDHDDRFFAATDTGFVGLLRTLAGRLPDGTPVDEA